MAAQIDQQQPAQKLVEQARAEGVELVGQGGLLTRLTRSVLETALEAEMAEHLGYDKHDPTGRNGGNSRNGTRTACTAASLVGDPQSASRCTTLIESRGWKRPSLGT